MVVGKYLRSFYEFRKKLLQFFVDFSVMQAAKEWLWKKCCPFSVINIEIINYKSVIKCHLDDLIVLLKYISIYLTICSVEWTYLSSWA